jgi:hypothetical protein
MHLLYTDIFQQDTEFQNHFHPVGPITDLRGLITSFDIQLVREDGLGNAD